MTGTETPALPTAQPEVPPARRRRVDPFLIGIVAGIAILLIAAVITLLLTRRAPVELPANTPGGVVQRYLSALEKQDYNGAYDYLASSIKDKPTRAEFIESKMSDSSYQSNRQIRIGKENIYNEQATVEISTTNYSHSSSPFAQSDSYTSTSTVSLKQENGQWRISEAPYIW